MTTRIRTIVVPLLLVAASGIGAYVVFSGRGDSTPTASESGTAAVAPSRGIPDLTKLSLGDGRTTTSGPKRDYLYLCREQSGGGGAQSDGPWIEGDTYNLDAKYIVDGNVEWPSATFEAKIRNEVLDVAGNGLPDHATGVFPIQAGSDAYSVDRNPNSISAQTLAETFSTRPQMLSEPQCAGGSVGIMTSGVVLFNAVDATGRDAVAHEVQDRCSGHPQVSGVYHYHGLPACIETGEAGQPPTVIGWALDGFPITGPLDGNGSYLANADLDACHGTTSEIDYLGEKVTLYHYVANYEFPYTVGCFRGDSAGRDVGGGAEGGGTPEGGPPGA